MEKDLSTQLIRMYKNPAFIIINLVQLGFLGVIWYFLQRLRKENCECALTGEYAILSRLIYVPLTYTLLASVMLVLILGGAIRSLPLSGAGGILLRAISTIVGLLNLVFFIISFKYLLGLYRSACACSDNSLRLVYMIYVAFVLGVFVLSILFIIILMVSLLVMVNNMSRKNKK